MRTALPTGPSALTRGLLVVLLAMPAVARAAADNDPPIITHSAKKELPRGRVKLDFRIVDQSALFGVLFHWRQTGDTSYRQIDFPTSQEKYVAEFEVQKDFEFWIEAYDEHGNGPALNGSADKPNRIKVVDAFAASADTGKQSGEKRTDEKRSDEKADDRQLDEKKPERKAERKADPCETGEAYAVDGLTPCQKTAVAQGPMRIARVGRVLAARNMNAGMFEASGSGGIMQGSDFLYASNNLFGTTGALQVGYAPLSFLSVYLGTGYRGATLSSPTPAVAPRTGGSAGDASLSLRFASGPLSIARLGFEAFVDIPSPVARPPLASNTAGGRENFALSPGFNGIVSLDVHPMVRVHANLGYKWDNSENLAVDRTWSSFQTFAWGLSRYDALNFALGAEIPLGNIVPFLEYSLAVPVNRRAFASCDGTCSAAPSALPALSAQLPQRLGLGARYEVNPLLAVDLGLDLSLTGASRGLSDTSATVTAALDGFAPPPPLAARLSLTYQFGAQYSQDDSSDVSIASQADSDQLIQ
jgi:hypothetical protein